MNLRTEAIIIYKYIKEKKVQTEIVKELKEEGIFISQGEISNIIKRNGFNRSGNESFKKGKDCGRYKSSNITIEDIEDFVLKRETYESLTFEEFLDMDYYSSESLESDNYDEYKHNNNHYSFNPYYNNKYKANKAKNTVTYDTRNMNINSIFEFDGIKNYIIVGLIIGAIATIIFPSKFKKDLNIEAIELKNGVYIGQTFIKKGNGYGRYFEENNKYIGEFKNNKLNGLGMLTVDNNSELVGEFKNNSSNGLCIYINSNDKENVFIGYYNNGEKDGIGVNINGSKFVVQEYKNNKIKSKIAQGDFYYPESAEIVNQESEFEVIKHEGRVFISKLKNKEFNNFTMSFSRIPSKEYLDITVDDYKDKKSTAQVIFNAVDDYTYFERNKTVNKFKDVFYMAELKKKQLNGLGMQYYYKEDRQDAYIGYFKDNGLRGKVWSVDKNSVIRTQTN